jgi:hypothetical protein
VPKNINHFHVFVQMFSCIRLFRFRKLHGTHTYKPTIENYEILFSFEYIYSERQQHQKCNKSSTIVA